MLIGVWAGRSWVAQTVPFRGMLHQAGSSQPSDVFESGLCGGAEAQHGEGAVSERFPAARPCAPGRTRGARWRRPTNVPTTPPDATPSRPARPGAEPWNVCYACLAIGSQHLAKFRP